MEVPKTDWNNLDSIARLQEILRIENNALQYIDHGEIGTYIPNIDVPVLGSEGFTNGVAIIARHANGSYTFAHSLPADRMFYDRFESQTHNITEGFMLCGTLGEPDRDIEELMKHRQCTVINIARIATGLPSFHVAFDTKTGLVSVARKEPDQSIVNLQPFSIG